MTKDELMIVSNFTVLKPGVGSIKFFGTTDIRGLDIDRYIQFQEHEIVVYPNEADKPFVGEGLNKPCRISLEQCFPIDKVTNRPIIDLARNEEFTKKLKKRAKNWGVDHISYEMAPNGTWTFEVKNFS